MKKVIEFLKGLSKTIKLIIFGVVLVVVLLLITRTWVSATETSVLIATFQKQSQLITGKITYPGYTKYSDSGTSFIDKGDFIILYEAEAAIGIEMSEIDISKNDLTKKITIKLPSCKVLYVDIKDVPEFVDKKFALFNFDKQEDTAKAIDYAEKDAIKQINKMGSIEYADEQAQNIIKGMFMEVIEKGYEIEFKSK